jgi:predicted lipoprotein
MRHWIPALIFAASSVLGARVWADDSPVTAIVESHILPGYARLAETGAALSMAAQADCRADSAPLQRAYHDAFDAWIAVSHLRFGPSETDDRAFALAFWPAPRSSTPKALGRMIQSQDPAVQTAATFQEVSVAVRGYYALEFLLYDDHVKEMGSADYRCALVRAIARDIAQNSAAIDADWRNTYAALMRNPGNDTYRNEQEVLRQLFTALSTGLELTANVRLGRPMGTFDRPRPLRAEARRSGRSQHHVALALESLETLAGLLSSHDPALMKVFESAMNDLSDLDDPVFAAVSDPMGRFALEALQQKILYIQYVLTAEIGPKFGFTAGFNSLDGD